jgi:hypothetical protein
MEGGTKMKQTIKNDRIGFVVFVIILFVIMAGESIVNLILKLLGL